MPKVNRDPPGVRPFTFHGMDLRFDVGDNQAVGDCPFCGKEEKFYVGQDDGLWFCHPCQKSGNPVQWLRMLWEASRFPEQPASLLAAERRLRAPQTLEAWGVRQSILTEEWLVPFYNSQGLLSQLCRYAEVNGRMILLPTPSAELGINDGVAGPHDLSELDDSNTVYLCEKPWDAMCLWEALDESEEDEVTVLSLRTASTWHDSYAPLLAGKKVVVMFDNDHPRSNGQADKMIPGGGLTGTKKVVASLAGLTPPAAPVAICHLAWGDEGHDADLPSGYDLRDWIPSSGPDDTEEYTLDVVTRQVNLSRIMARVKPVPDSWLEDGKVAASAKKGQLDIKPKKCESWQELRESFEDALYWTDGLDRALSVVLAACTSLDMPQDQVWVRVISPPSGGKTTLLEAISVCKKHVRSESNIKSFYSGYQVDKEGSQDFSLAAKVHGKVLVTKDIGPLLESPYRDSVMGQARDIYDGNATSPFLNKMGKTYANHRMVWLMGGTDAIANMDASELGERSLTVRVMDRIDPKMEDEIGLRAIREVFGTRSQSASSGEGQYPPKLRAAYALTGGYVEYLRANATRLLSRIEPSEQVVEHVHTLGLFVAYMRARPPKKHEERSGREMATRLRKQLAKLTICLAVVMQKPQVDDEVMSRVWHVAMDTSRGRSLQVVQTLRKTGRRGGILLEELAEQIKHPRVEKLYDLMRFLDDEGVVERFNPEIIQGKGVRGRPRWRITARMLELYDRVTALGK